MKKGEGYYKFMRIANHPLTKICLGWLFVLTVWLVLPVDDTPFVGQVVEQRSPT